MASAGPFTHAILSTLSERLSELLRGVYYASANAVHNARCLASGQAFNRAADIVGDDLCFAYRSVTNTLS